MKPKKLLVLALFSGLVTTLIFYLFLNQLQPTVAKDLVMVSVVTASQDIKENQEITKESITMVEVPEERVHAQAIKDPKKVIGHFTSASIKSGEVIMTHRLQQEEEAMMISKKVKEGHRAVSISVDFVKSVSNLIEPGDYVDVVLTSGAESEGNSVTTDFVLEKAKILAVGQRMVEKKEGEAPVEYQAVTLELNKEDAIAVIAASGKGSLQLALHSKRKAANAEAESAEQEETETVNSKDSQIITLPERSLIRSAPDLAAPITVVVESGTSLRYWGEEKTDEEDRLWFRVETPDEKTGWISSRIIKFENE